MSRSAKVYFHDKYAGILWQDEEGYSFIYDSDYLNLSNSQPISLTLPLRVEAYQSKTMFSFFDGLIPGGWYLEIDNSALNPHDRMGLLLSLCKSCIGAVSIQPMEGVNHE